MRKFILIDPSITELGGHYYEYAARVLDAAGRHGFEPVLGANRGAGCLGAGPWRVVPAYRFGFFEPGPPRALRWARRTAGVAFRRAHGRQADAGIESGTGWANAWSSMCFGRKRRAFFADSARFFRAVPLNAGDLVFLPTVAEADMLGLADLFRADRNTTEATWHLLFRRDVPQANPGLARSRRHFEQFASRSSGRQVFFYTDTEPLTAEYNRLGRVSFCTLPIPIANSDRPPGGEIGRGGGLRHVVYLGDARTEKGYHWLPRLVSDAKAAGLPVRFTFQSNFNVPGGEPAAAEARAELASLPTDFGVTLLTEPLSSQGYLRLLLAADVVVIPYDAAAYKARSSGVFAEALAAGKPVIVPEGTWMAGELRRAGGESGVIYRDARELAGHLARIVCDYDHYRAAAHDYSRTWSHYHSPDTLLRQLAARSAYFGSPTGLAAHAILI
ncbi:MAG TPA: glycosyltransferase [Pirellulales bacterium]|nr:glycosyltransferase [Pirellulales bacterium]